MDTTNIGLATPGAVKAYTFFQSLVQKKIIPADIQTSANAGVVQGLFQKGQLGMWIDGDWDILANQKALGKNFGAAPLPTLDGNTPHPFAGVQVGFVSAFSHSQALAWSLVQVPAADLPDRRLQGCRPHSGTRGGPQPQLAEVRPDLLGLYLTRRSTATRCRTCRRWHRYGHPPPITSTWY